MGASKNKTIRALIKHIIETDAYKNLYDQYNLIYENKKKVQEEALVQVLAVALVHSYETEDYKKGCDLLSKLLTFATLKTVINRPPRPNFLYLKFGRLQNKFHLCNQIKENQR